MSAIPFVTLDDPQLRRASIRSSPLIRRVVADNPSKFTYLGTGTYIVGDPAAVDVAVIDPGPLLDAPPRRAARRARRASGHGDPRHPLPRRPLAARGAGCASRPARRRSRFGPHATVDDDLDDDADARRATSPTPADADGARSGRGRRRTDRGVDRPRRSSPTCASPTATSPPPVRRWTMRGRAHARATPRTTCASRSTSRARCSPATTSWAGAPPSSRRPTATCAPTSTRCARSQGRADRDLLADPRRAGHRHRGRSSTRSSSTASTARRRCSPPCAAGSTRIPAIVAVLYADVRDELHKPAARSVLAHLVKLVDDGAVAVEGGGRPRLRSVFAPA